ncbi:MAG: AAA family ATPase [Deltaproteobacteria bacterium]|nr:AAA family ATPase [Deltaproteobacteria bacterium]
MLHSTGKREAERRSATVMFADIVGFTTMSEKMDPEDLTSLMNSCFSMMENVIDGFGGVVDKFIGDCVMALFGVPFAAENAAQRAVNTAIELKRCLVRFNNEQDLIVPLDIHIGINTGVVVAGGVGGSKKRDYTVMGETVNIASRLESASVAGQVLVGPDTYSSTRHLFRFKELKDLHIKGKKEIVRIYELLSAQKSIYRKASCRQRSISSQVVGRDSEIAFIENGLKSLFAGKGGIINLIGEAGSGKTRIVLELKNKTIMENFQLLEGSAVSIGKNLRYHLFIDLLRHLLGITEEETESASLGKLRKLLGPLLAKDAEEVVTFAALVMGIKVPEQLTERLNGIEGEAIEILIKKNIRHLLAKLSKKRPLVVLLEDIHWADKSSTDLLESLLDLAATKKIFFINVFRPLYSEFCDKLIKKGRDLWPTLCSDITLQPLSKKACKILISNLLDTDRLLSHVQEKILSAGSGNPFFIEEILRSFIDCGVIVRKNESFQLAGGVNNVTIPQKVSDVLMERIDRLDSPTRDVIRVASVIGKNFFYSIIREVIDSDKDVKKSLEKLKASQFITKHLKKEGVEYGFSHELAREAAYKSILRQTKRAIHLKTAKAIETVFAERLSEFYGMLSYHYGKAGNPENAEAYMLKAGEEALRTGASNEALYYYRKALNIYLVKYGNAADPEKRATLEKNIAFSLYSKGQHAEAAEYYRALLKYHGLTLIENKAIFIVGFLFCFFEFVLNLYLPFIKKRKSASPKDIELIDLYYQMLISLSSFDPKKFFMEAFYFSRLLSKYDLATFKGGAGMFASIGMALSWSAVSFTLSKKILEFVMGSVRKDDARSLLYFEAADLMRCYYTGAWKKGYHKHLVERGLNIGEIMHIAVYISFHGRIMIEQGHYEMAKKLVLKLAYVGNAYSHDFARALKYYLNTILLLKYRKLHAALIEAQEGIVFMLKKDFKQLVVVQYSCKAKIHTLLKNSRAAKRSIDEAGLIKSNVRLLPPYLGNYFLGKSCCELSLLEEMITTGKKTKELGKMTRVSLRNMMKRAGSMACDRTEAFRLMGCYYGLIGRNKKSLKWLQKSVQEGKTLGARPELARAYMHLGLYLLKSPIKKFQDNDTLVKKYLGKAQCLLREMNLEWDMAELKKREILLKNRSA